MGDFSASQIRPGNDERFNMMTNAEADNRVVSRQRDRLAVEEQKYNNNTQREQRRQRRPLRPLRPSEVADEEAYQLQENLPDVLRAIVSGYVQRGEPERERGRRRLSGGRRRLSGGRRRVSPSREEEVDDLQAQLLDDLQAQLPDDLRKLVLGYIPEPDAIITTTDDPVERGVTVAELMVLLHDDNEDITTLVAVRPLFLTAVWLPYVRRLEGPVALYGDCQGMFEGNREPMLRLDMVDTSGVTSMRSMFEQSSFNGDLHTWNTANVTDMSCMFAGATRFNQVVTAWDTGKVTDMSHMFAGATRFNQVVREWDTTHVSDLSGMFAGATNFNQAGA
jgi:surface protein